MTDRDALIALTHFIKFGPAGLKKLCQRLGSWSAVWTSGEATLSSAGLSPALAKEFATWRASFDWQVASRALECEKIKTVVLGEADYPEPLANISQPPLVIYYQGHLQPSLWRQALAVVGSRKFSAYGRRVIEDLIKPVAASGLTVVSGLALGIDALAHQATLAGGGLTVAVLGSGLDGANLYPSANRGLARAIIDHGGLVLSEFAPGTAGFKFNFPRRNRIIAGLAQGTLVIEAGLKSGSLITANYALDANREVLAVPNSIYAESSAGTNYLLQMGAKLVMKAEDIREALNLKPLRPLAQDITEEMELDKEEIIIMQALASQAKKVDELTKELKFDISTLNARLSLMEIKGLIGLSGGAFIALKRLKGK